jgi:hypothetical protein
MSSQGTGPQNGLTPQQFLGLKVPIHLPTLVSQRGEDTPHLPTAHHTMAIEVASITDVLPIRSGYDFGSQEEFSYLANTNEILTSCTLCVQLSRLTLQGGGNSPRYVDDILCAAIEKIEWLYGSNNPIETIEGDELHFCTLHETAEEELERKYALQAAGLTVAERATLATADQWVYIDIPWFWTKAQAGHWHAYCWGRPTRVRITWRNVDYLLQQTGGTKPIPFAGAAAPYMKQKFIRFHTTTPTESTKQVYMKKIQDQGDHGQLTLFKDVQKQEFTIGASETSLSAKVDMFTKYGYNLRFILRPEANLAADLTNNKRWEVLDISTLQFNIANKIYYPLTDDWYHKHVYEAKWYLGNHEIPIYNIPFTNYPDLHSQAMGGLEFSNTINPTLLLTFPAPNTNVPAIATVRLTAWCYAHNYVRQVLRGVQSAMETVQPL